MKHLVLLVIVLAFALVTTTEVFASETKLIEGFEVDPYFKAGTERGNTAGRPAASGRKSYIGYGMVFTPEDLSWFIKDVKEKFGFELWATNEPSDEDPELVGDGLMVFFQAQKAFEEGGPFYYFGKLDLISWKRNCDPENPNGHWNDLLFTTATVGVGAEYERFYSQVGAILPLSVNVDSGRRPAPKLGYTFNLGAKWKHFKAEFFYDRINFGGGQNLKLCGARIGFPF